MSFKSSATIQKISLISAIVSLALSVLFLLPISDNFVFNSKVFILFFTTIGLLGLFISRSVFIRALEFVVAPFTLPLFLFGLSTVASIFFTNSYPYENLLGFGGIYLAVVIIGLITGSLFSRDAWKPFLLSLGLISAILSVSSIFQAIGYGPANIYNALFKINVPTTLLFNLTGSSLIGAQILLITLIGLVFQVVKLKSLPKSYAVVIPLLVIGLGIHIWSMLPNKASPIILSPASASWSVALDSIRSPRAAIIGVGTAGYQNVYNQFKPLWVNGTPLWNTQFSQGVNVPLTLLSTHGFFGLVSWLLLVIVLFKQFSRSTSEGKILLSMILVAIGIQLFLPANPVLLSVFALLLGLFTATEKQRFSHLEFHPFSIKMSKRQLQDFNSTSEEKKSSISTTVGALVGLSLVLSLLYLTGRAYAAHIYMNESSKAAQRDDGVAVYENQQRAVQLNPYLDYLRREYAVTNMLIAAALSNKTDATEQERAQVTQLVQQAIREARSATLLDPNDTQNWLVLAQIYQNMIGITEEAEQWAIQSYVQAIETNPTDPSLRINLGGIFLNKQQFQQAGQLFAQAAELKPDLPNAQYNLAITLQNLQQYEDAKLAYQRVLTLLEPNSEDYTRVTSELETLEKLIEENKAASTSAQTDETSIIQQNLEGESSLINQPSDADLELDSNTSLSEPIPSPSASPATN